MLEPVEFLPARRHYHRHAFQLEVPMICDLWDEPVSHRTRDLSAEGLYIETELPLEPGTEVVLELSVALETHFVIGCVRRVDLGKGTARSGMGIELLDIDEGLRASIERALARKPPALPRSRVPIEKKFLWVDALLTYEEDLGDRINIVEVSEALCLHEDDLSEAFGAATTSSALLC
jgi:hypothetical protein